MENQSEVNQHQNSERQKEEFQNYTWKWFFAKEAEGITASSAGVEYTHFMKRHFGMDLDYKQLLRNSVDEICNRMNADIDQALINNFIGQCDDIRIQYLTYLEAKIEGKPGIIKTQLDKLLELESKAGSTVKELLNQFSLPKVLGPIGMACSLHFVVIIELIPNAAEYNDTLTRLSTEYSNLLEKGSQQFFEQVKTNVNESDKDRDVFLNLANAWRLLPEKHGL